MLCTAPFPFAHLGAAIPIIVLPLHGDIHAGRDFPLHAKLENVQVGFFWSFELRNRNTRQEGAGETKIDE